MATEQKYITVPQVSFDLEQLLDIIRQLDKPAQLQIAAVLTETLADKHFPRSHPNTTQLNLGWRGGLSNLPDKPTSVDLQHQSLTWWEA